MSVTADQILNAPGNTHIAAKHTRLEDAVALLVGALLISFGLDLYRNAGLLSGGTAGIAFLLHYAAGLPFGPVFFALNLPFYWLAIRRMGYAFAFKTFVAVCLLSALTGVVPGMITIDKLDLAFASVFGGVMLGIGSLALFRHRSSVGGLGVFGLYLQGRFGWRAGKIQMAVDCGIVSCAFFVIDPTRVAWSVLSAVIFNALLALNHKSGRYIGF